MDRGVHDPEESVHPEEEKVRCNSAGDFSRAQEVEPTDEVKDLAVDPEPELDVAMRGAAVS